MSSNVPMHLAESTFAGILIGGVMASGLWGMSCVQAYSCVSRSSNDQRIAKYTMTFLTMGITVQTFLIVHVVYYYLITQYGNPTSATHILWSELAGLVLMEILNFVIRGLYARHIWLLSEGNSKWLVGAIGCSSIVTVFNAIATRIVLFRLDDYSAINTGTGVYKSARLLGYTTFAFSLLSGALITAGMCCYMYKQRIGFSKMFIKTLLVYLVATGLLSLIVAMIATIVTIALPYDNWKIMFAFVQANLNFCSYLAALNAQHDLQVLSNLTISGAQFATDISHMSTVYEKDDINEPVNGGSGDDGLLKPKK